MFRKVLFAKIHSATVTESNLGYNGSLGISKDLLIASGIKRNEKIEIYNITNGNRLSTYVIEEEKPGQIIVNGAAAHLAKAGDEIIIAAYAYIKASKMDKHNSLKVFVNKENNITKVEQT